MPRLTGIVYKDPRLMMFYERDMFGFYATKDIPKGTIILLEHVLSCDRRQSDRYMDLALQRDRLLRRSLYPRQPSPDDPEKTPTRKHKVAFNAFGFGKHIVLGNLFSKFNHECKPNANMAYGHYFPGVGYVYALFATRRIRAHEQITITYDKSGSYFMHIILESKHGFYCDCTKDYIEAFPLRDRDMALMELKYLEGRNDWIHKQVRAYAESAYGRPIIRAQAQLRKDVSRSKREKQKRSDNGL